MRKQHKAVITGLGIVSPVGNTLESAWKNLIEGRSGISNITLFDASKYSCRIGGQVPDFDPVAIFGTREARRMDRYCQFAMCAADAAVKDSGLDVGSLDSSRAGVCLGTGIGGLLEIELQHSRLVNGGPDRVSPFLIPKMMANSAPGHIAIKYGLRGPNWAVATACASGTHALGEAARAIEQGFADVIISGGSEAGVTPLGTAAFCSLKALSTRDVPPSQASCPFDANRDGFVLGEGCGILVLESEEHAKKRGARIRAVLAGYGNTCDAFHITAPADDGSGAAAAMSVALADAGVNTGDVDYINAHGTSTKLNDVMETLAIKNVFGDRAPHIAASSTKSMTGHLLGGSGGIETIVCVLAIEHGVVPPTINLHNPDPDCDLDYVPCNAREMPVRTAMKNSFGFGGHNAALVLVKP